LDADTGKIVWFFQHIPAETHDLDEVFENILVDRDGRQSLFKMGKIGVLWELDRKTGKFLNAFDLGYQTVLDIDKKTGRATYRPGVVPKLRVLSRPWGTQEPVCHGLSSGDRSVLHSSEIELCELDLWDSKAAGTRRERLRRSHETAGGSAPRESERDWRVRRNGQPIRQGVVASS
jgi:hypothetical protein